MTPASAIPQGTNRSYQERSTSQFSAKPCIVTPRLTRMPMAAILRSGRGAPELVEEPASSQTPLRPGTRAVVTPRSAHTADQRLLEAADEVDDQHVVGEPHDRVADELAGAVEGDLAAAVDLDHRGAVGGTLVGLGALAGRVDGGVLEQQHGAGSTRDHLRRAPRAGAPTPRGSRRAARPASRRPVRSPDEANLARTQPVDNRLRPRDRRQGGRMRILAVLPLLASLCAPAAHPAAPARRRRRAPRRLAARARRGARGAARLGRTPSARLGTGRPRCAARALRARVRGGPGRRPAAARLPGARARRTPPGDAGVRGPGAAQRRDVLSRCGSSTGWPGERCSSDGDVVPLPSSPPGRPGRSRSAATQGPGGWPTVSDSGCEPLAQHGPDVRVAEVEAAVQQHLAGTQLTEPRTSLAIRPAAGRSTNAGHAEERRPVHQAGRARG